MGGKLIQVPFLYFCEYMHVLAEEPKNQLHQDVLGIHKTARRAQLEISLSLSVHMCADDSLQWSHTHMHSQRHFVVFWVYVALNMVMFLQT